MTSEGPSGYYHADSENGVHWDDPSAGTEPKSAYGVPSGRLLTEPAPALGLG